MKRRGSRSLVVVLGCALGAARPAPGQMLKAFDGYYAWRREQARAVGSQ